MDKVTEMLVQALKSALAHPDEQRLFKSGKLPGLFPGRTGPAADAAARALRENLLEVVRTEPRGKTTFEWVKATPAGVRFLHDTESPLEVLREVRSALETSREGVPVWLDGLRRELQTLGDRLAAEVRHYTHRLEALTGRVEEALRRADALAPHEANGLSETAPWARHALDYLDRRAAGGGNGCPLPELFAALRGDHADLSLTSFHDGLRRLSDLRALRLLPAEPGQALAEPEHALLDGPSVLYYASR